MIGLKRGTVCLCAHEAEWEQNAAQTIMTLKEILGEVAVGIEHVGSTSVPRIKAKPIIDIAVAVHDFDDVLKRQPLLQSHGFYYRPKCDIRDQLLFGCGSYYNGTGDLQTHFIHVVKANSMEWINYINFRNYLNHTPSVAKEYENLKLALAAKAPVDNGREQYLKGKHDFIVATLRKALADSYLGKTVTIKIDRPAGSAYPQYPDLIYPINYGYLPGVVSGDGEEMDVYILGVDEPMAEFTGKIIGIIHRANDVEDKLVAAPSGMIFSREQIAVAVHFQEQYYESTIETSTKNQSIAEGL